VVLSVQNGVDNQERLAAVVGAGPVLGSIAALSAYVEAPAVIVEHGGFASIRFGELVDGVSPRAERLMRELQGVGFGVELVPDMRVQLWEKFVFICAFSGVTSLTRLPMGAIGADPATGRLYRGVLEETAAVGRAEGVALPEDTVERWYQRSIALPPGVYGSMYHDLAAGRRMELEGLNGTAVRLGEAHSVTTPLNFAIYAALRPYADGAPPP
jgi:2-dehydropantoate 2-reductase